MPSRESTRSRSLPIAIGGVVCILLAGIAGWYFFLRPTAARADVLLYTIKREPLIVSVTEKGTLESADNRDIVCKVRAGSKGFSTTINWVIEDGSRVKPGQLLMILDDSALKEQEEKQQIEVHNALTDKVKAEQDYEIEMKKNAIAIETARNNLVLAEIELEKFTGVDFDPTLTGLAALGGGIASLTETGAFRQEVDNLIGEIRQLESDVEQNRERAAWADRMVKLTYMSPAQAQSERSRLDSSIERLRSRRDALRQLMTYDRKQRLADLTSKRETALRALEQAELEANAKLVQFTAEKKKTLSIYLQAAETLRDLVQQRAECRITAPDSIEPDSMVVYFKMESNRFSNNQQGMIEQGAQVKEGQKLLRIPNLNRMQVNTKIHEAMVARVRGDERVPTHIVDGTQAAMLLNTDPFTRLVSQRQDMLDRIRERFRNHEYMKLSDGQKASIRIDALPDRVFEGHVRTVANVASQADSWISDVKLYLTVVMIDNEVLPDGTRKKIEGERLKPDMTAEVTITVDTAVEPVLAVPVQAVMGSTEMGAKREVYVKSGSGYERREVVLGIYNDKVVEIREGLKEGDEIVLNPKVLLSPDDATRTRDAESKGWKGEAGSQGGQKGSGSTKGGRKQ